MPKTLVLALALTIGFSSLSWGLTPDSAEVKALVKKGLDFLERGAPAMNVPGSPVMPIGGDERLGEKVLAGLCFFKAGKEDHRLVKAAIQAVYTVGNLKETDNYSLGLAIIFLSELGDKQHLPQIQMLVDEMLSRQQVKGGFGYTKANGMGDTSQIQYAVLAFWNARMAGAKVPKEAIENVCDFLIRIQDPAGGWCYNGSDPGSYERTPQSGVTHSLTAAGLGSICVCAHMLGIHNHRGDDDEEEQTGLPDALKVVKKPKAQVAQATVETRIDPALVERAIKDGQNWFAQNYKIETGLAWNYYYLYGLERCESFRELYYSSKIKQETKWYNDGVAFLAKKSQGGGWAGDHSAKASTSFAVLFLLRSSRKAIAKVVDLGDGVLTSGKGLPADLTQVSVKRGQVVDSAAAADLENLTAMLDDPDNPEFARILDNNEDFQLDKDSTKRSNQITKLRSLVSAGNWEARMIAVRGLGKVRDLDNVPSLLYALSDPDGRVVLEADIALRFISRKLQGVGMPSEPETKTPEGRKAIEGARRAWREWYLSIRPNAELID